MGKSPDYHSSGAGGDRGQPCRWHQALAYAIAGLRLDVLGEQQQPDLAQLIAELSAALPRHVLERRVTEARERGEPWPHPVPEDLMAGVNRAQFVAALAKLQRELALVGARDRVPRVGIERPLTNEERRLLDEVPPHHAS